MKASDLRIGNIVQNKDGVEEAINSIFLYGPLESINDESSTYQPIRLTNQWVNKLGFVHEEPYVNKDYKVDIFKLSNFEVKFASFGECKVLYDGKTLKHIEYVHQLQNLFFALKGIELEIK